MFKKGILKVWIPLIFLMGLWIICCGGAQASSMDAVWPETPGYDVRTDGSLVIDASNLDKGYVMVRGQPTNNGLKIRIRSGQWELNYDLNSQGQYEAFPLQKGSAVYEVALFENVKGNKYASGGKVTRKNTFLPLAMGGLIGGTGSLAGSTAPLLASDVLEMTGNKPFSFFSTAPVALCIIGVIALCYWFFLYKFQKK